MSRATTALLPIATRYSTVGVSRKSKPPSSRTRKRAFGNATRNRGSVRRNMAMAPLLLLPAGGVVGVAQVDVDALDASAETAAIAFDDAFGQGRAHAQRFPRAHAVLEARQRRLRRQRLTTRGVAVRKELLGWIMPLARGIVGVLVPAGDAVDALP